jgi:hypothetical protein
VGRTATFDDQTSRVQARRSLTGHQQPYEPIRSKQSPAVAFQYANVAPVIGIAPATVHSSDTLGTARRSGVGSIASEKLLVATSIDA